MIVCHMVGADTRVSRRVSRPEVANDFHGPPGSTWDSAERVTWRRTGDG
jgi:hypothetical protein